MELHKFDPEGDLLLILGQQPGEEVDWEAETDEGSVDLISSSDEPSPISVEHASNLITLVEGPNFESRKPLKEIQMLVSSRHMMLASPVWKAMLQHSNFKEGEQLRSKGKVEVPLPDDDPTAFELLLNIIHGRVRQVPRQVTLETVASLGVLVDKYQMQEVVELHVELWMPALRSKLPGRLTEDYLQWLSISWVFKLRAEFKILTRIAIRESSCKLSGSKENSFLVPDTVLDKIDQQRQKSISDFLFVVQQLINTFTQSTSVCAGTQYGGDSATKKFKCDGMLLGTLLKSAAGLAIWPPPPTPYDGISVKNIAERVRSLKLVAVCDEWAPIRPAHGYAAWVKERADVLDARVTGLDLDIFK